MIRRKSLRVESAAAVPADSGDPGRHVGTGVTLGLLAAWAVHDAEELARMPHWFRTRLPELRERHPQVPDAVWDRMEAIEPRQFALAVGLMGVVTAAMAADGARTGGRSATYQSALNAFGLHGVMHLAQAAAARSWTPGAATSPLVVIPFTLWARGRLRRAGVLRPTGARETAVAVGLTAAALAGTHGVARRLLKGRG